jgi:hypothetical protein
LRNYYNHQVREKKAKDQVEKDYDKAQAYNYDKENDQYFEYEKDVNEKV